MFPTLQKTEHLPRVAPFSAFARLFNDLEIDFVLSHQPVASSVVIQLSSEQTHPKVKPAKIPPNATKATAIPTFIQKLALSGLSSRFPNTASSPAGRECKCGMFAATNTAILPSALEPPPPARDLGIDGIYGVER